MEGGTYLVGWRSSKGKTKVWLEEQRSVQAVGANLEEALDALYLEVMEWNGDGEAAFELTPRPPVQKFPRSRRYVGLAYNEAVEIENDPADLFAGGTCPTCRRGRGDRSPVKVRLKTNPRTDVFRLQRPWPSDLYPYRLGVSDRFVSALTELEVASLDLREVETPGFKSVSYFEICGRSIAGAVGLRDAKYAAGFSESWRCASCGRAQFYVDDRKLMTAGFVALSSFERVVPECFVFDGDGRHGPIPAFSEDRWRKVVECSPKIRGLCGSDVYLVPDDLVDREPTLPNFVE